MGLGASFGSQLRRWRVAVDVSLAELARRTHYSKGYLSKIETGTRPPTRVNRKVVLAGHEVF